MTYDYGTAQPSGSEGSKAQGAKDEARNVAHDAGRSGRRLAGEAKGEAKDVGREAGRQAKDLLDQGRTQLTSQASDQQRKLAEGVRSFGGELHTMADASEQPGIASDLAHQAAARADTVADWLEQRQPADLLDEVKTFARRRPGLFLGIAAVAGLVAGRVVRGVKDESSNGSRELTTTGSAGYETTGTTTRTSAYAAAGGTASAGAGTYGTGPVSGSGDPLTSGTSTGTTSGTPAYGEGGPYGSGTTAGTAGTESGTTAGSTGYGTESSAGYRSESTDTPAYGTEPAPAWSPVDDRGLDEQSAADDAGLGEGDRR